MTDDDDPTLRFGWLEAFVAVAESHDYRAAGEKLGLHPSNVQRNVEHLERWLRSILVMNGGSAELSHPTGADFLPVALEALAMLEPLSVPEEGTKDVSPRDASGKAFIDILDFECFLAVAKWMNFDEAAFRLSVSTSRVRRGVKALEGVLGIRLIVGRSLVKTAPEAEAFAVSAARIVDLIRKHRRTLSLRYDPIEQAANHIYNVADRERKSIEAMVSILEKRKRLSPDTRRSLVDARMGIRFLNRVCGSIVTE